MSKSNVTPNISVAPSSNSGNASMTMWSSCLDVAAGTVVLDGGSCRQWSERAESPWAADKAGLHWFRSQFIAIRTNVL